MDTTMPKVAVTPIQGHSGSTIEAPCQSVRPPETKNKAKANLSYLWKRSDCGSVTHTLSHNLTLFVISSE